MGGEEGRHGREGRGHTPDDHKGREGVGPAVVTRRRLLGVVYCYDAIHGGRWSGKLRKLRSRGWMRVERLGGLGVGLAVGDVTVSVCPRCLGRESGRRGRACWAGECRCRSVSGRSVTGRTCVIESRQLGWVVGRRVLSRRIATWRDKRGEKKPSSHQMSFSAILSAES